MLWAQRRSISPCITFLDSRKESSISCAWGWSSQKLRLTHPIFFKIQIFSYGLNIPDKTSGEAMEGKEILMFRQGSYTCHQVTKQNNSAGSCKAAHCQTEISLLPFISTPCLSRCLHQPGAHLVQLWGQSTCQSQVREIMHQHENRNHVEGNCAVIAR